MIGVLKSKIETDLFYRLVRRRKQCPCSIDFPTHKIMAGGFAQELGATFGERRLADLHKLRELVERQALSGISMLDFLQSIQKLLIAGDFSERGCQSILRHVTEKYPKNAFE